MPGLEAGHNINGESMKFAQLQRDYRQMEIDRRKYAEESHNQLRKQQSTLNTLKKDNEQLKAELAIEMRSASRGATNLEQEVLAKLQDEMDYYTTSNATEKRTCDVLKQQLEMLKKNAQKQRRVMGGVNAARDNHNMVNKQIRILENRLDKALIRFNESLANNKKLRETIDDLRRERIVFDNVYKKMEKELSKKKSSIAYTIELSNQSYEQRDNFQLEIAAIEQANRKEQEDFDGQMDELNQALEDALKNNSNHGGNGKKNKNGEAFLSGSMDKEEEDVMKNKLKKQVWSLAAEKSDTKHAEERIQSFEEAFARIKAATNFQDIEELVRTFIKNEENNFSLFNYVNEQTNEMEHLEEEILKLKEEESKFKADTDELSESSSTVVEDEEKATQAAAIKEVETKISNTGIAADKLELRCTEVTKIIEALKRGVSSLFDKLGCRNMSEVLSSSNVTENNVMQFLGIVEQRSNEILHNYLALRKEEEERLAEAAALNETNKPSKIHSPPRTLASVLGQGPNIAMGENQINVNPPRLEDYSSGEGSDDDDGEARPLTREELKNKTLNRLKNKAGKEQKRARAAKNNAVLGRK